ncbi:MAG: copper-binding protein [Thermoanaerobaculia bacterium]
MRGRLERPVDPDRTLWIRHESVPEFRDERGEKVGMESMLMPFTPADDLNLAGLAAGDKIAFTLAVSWTAVRRPIQILAWSRLPADTQLEFERPPAGENGTPR